MEYTFIREWSGIDTLVITADSLEDAELILDNKEYNPQSIERSAMQVNDEWEQTH